MGTSRKKLPSQILGLSHITRPPTYPQIIYLRDKYAQRRRINTPSTAATWFVEDTSSHTQYCKTLKAATNIFWICTKIYDTVYQSFHSGMTGHYMVWSCETVTQGKTPDFPSCANIYGTSSQRPRPHLYEADDPSARRVRFYHYMARPANVLAHVYMLYMTPLRHPGKPNSFTFRPSAPEHIPDKEGTYCGHLIHLY
eukprot:SAG31_NODE_1912_length_6935_cov_40.528525_2_plen_197_part_00